jgi:glyoxylase-like metal-dependent hydrolase (beta-lactamase superfamily II)
MVGERPKPFGEALGFDPITSTLIFGEYDAVLVDAMGTVAEAEALADWVALHNRNLETIYITHAHFDHFYGLSILLDRFPSARAIATPKTVNAMQMSFSSPVERLARRLFPGQVPTKLVPPEPYEPDSFTLEGHELRIIEQGRTDSPDSTSLYVPSIGLIVAGDVVYNQCRIYGRRHNRREPRELDRGARPVSGAEPGDRCRRSQEAWRARFSLDDPRHQTLHPGLRPGAENRCVRSGVVRSDDGAVPALGSQSVVVDVRIPAALTTSTTRTSKTSKPRARQERSFVSRAGP